MSNLVYNDSVRYHILVLYIQNEHKKGGSSLLQSIKALKTEKIISYDEGGFAASNIELGY